MKQEVSSVGRRVDLNLMVVFEAVYRARNLTAAGRNIGLSQSAMSHALSRLRAIFRDPLFVRRPRGLEPTAFATEMAPSIMEGLATIRRGFEARSFEPAISNRIFMIAMGDLTESSHLPAVLRAVRREAPLVRVRTVDVPAAQRRAALADGKVDLALSNSSAEMPVRCEFIGDHGYKTIASKSHPRIGTKLTLAAFREAGHILVMAPGGARHGEVIERALRRPRIDARIEVQIGSYYPVANLVTESDLIATIPPRLAYAIARTAPIRVFDPPIPLPRARMYLWWHERNHRDVGNKWLRELYLRETRPLYPA